MVMRVTGISLEQDHILRTYYNVQQVTCSKTRYGGDLVSYDIWTMLAVYNDKVYQEIQKSTIWVPFYLDNVIVRPEINRC